jgi:hypothetical protein
VTRHPAWPLAEPLDGYLREVVQTLRDATERGMRQVGDTPAEVERTIAECQEILEVIMEGDVQAWFGSEAGGQ